MYPFLTIFNKNISAYGLLMLVAVVTVFILAFKRAKKRGVSIDDMFIVGAFTLLGALTLANTLYVFVTYNVAEIISAILKGRFEIFGGLVYYGGLIGGVIGGIVGCKMAGVKTETMEISIVPYLPIGHAIGRIGCVMAGCCHGMEYEGLFALHYPNSVEGLAVEQGYFPVQILEAALNIMIALLLILYSKKERRPYGILMLYLVLYAITRFTLEFLRGDELRGIYFGLSVSQWISVMLLVVSIGYYSVLKIKHSD